MQKIILDSIPSTQTEAKLRVSDTQRPFVVYTQNQSGGYGKFGREWVSDRGNFTATFAVDISIQHYDFGKIPMLICIQLCELLSGLTNTQDAFRIKWPNDIVLNRKKLGGVLIEKIEETLLVGIGLNLIYSPKHISSEYEAGNITDELGMKISPQTVLEQLSEYFSDFACRFDEISAADVRQTYMTLLEGIGHEIKVVTRHETLMGKLQDINSDGALVLDVNGEHKLIYSADIFL